MFLIVRPSLPIIAPTISLGTRIRRGKSLVERIGEIGLLLDVGLIGARFPLLRSDAAAEDGRRTSSMKVT